MIVGLTGGIGSGKSAAAKFFIELGIDVIDADEVSKNILLENKKAKKDFITEFGSKYIKNNKIDRELLRKEIFKDKTKKKILESIIHPAVRDEISKFIINSDSIYKIVMVPLIVETNSVEFYDKIIVIDCETKLQLERASDRDNQSKENIADIMQNQASRKERLEIADFVILNNSDLENLRGSVIKTHQKLLGIKLDE
tara:strand:- start:13940 stop:14533 length:594 start_codon:yes stop_codon:yes gene_type:complete